MFGNPNRPVQKMGAQRSPISQARSVGHLNKNGNFKAGKCIKVLEYLINMYIIYKNHWNSRIFPEENMIHNGNSTGFGEFFPRCSAFCHATLTRSEEDDRRTGSWWWRFLSPWWCVGFHQEYREYHGNTGGSTWRKTSNQSGWKKTWTLRPGSVGLIDQVKTLA